MKNVVSVLVAGVFFCSVGLAQKTAATSTITGRVICADTNAPARLAVVVLRPLPSATTADSSAPAKSVEAHRVQAQLDGMFYFPRVAPGAYIVLASMPGYTSTLAGLGLSNDDLLEPTTELRKRILESVPTVTVDGNGSASINISLERAASVSGTILYDDGSPAAGIQVSVRERKKGKLSPIQNFAVDGMGAGIFTTDDRGNYRITGLPSIKEAIVEADISLQNSTLGFGKHSFSTSGGPSFSLAFYSGNALRLTAAKPFELTTGEDRPGEDITLPLSRLHKVQGALVAKNDGHVLNQGTVTLLFADDQTQLGTAIVGEHNDTFDFAFVPEGDYVLRVDSAADARFEVIPYPPGSTPPSWTKSTALKQYGTVQVPLHVDRDRTDVTVSVPDTNSAATSAGQP